MVAEAEQVQMQAALMALRGAAAGQKALASLRQQPRPDQWVRPVRPLCRCVRPEAGLPPDLDRLALMTYMFLKLSAVRAVLSGSRLERQLPILQRGRTTVAGTSLCRDASQPGQRLGAVGVNPTSQRTQE